jgi:PhoPQ-activated pathogenicity-related protein
MFSTTVRHAIFSATFPGRRSLSWLIPLAMLAALSACRQAPAPGARLPAPANPFERYIAAPDTAFGYELMSRRKGPGYTAYILRMTSQRWLSPQEVDEPLWRHWLTIVAPDLIEHSTALLWIGGGTSRDSLPNAVNPIVAQAALSARAIAADLSNVPNQPLRFAGDDFGPRHEDELIAYGWRRFLEGGARDEDVHWLARLPMTKAAARAMDAVSAFSHDSLRQAVERFVVAGASKRGWTTWTSAVMDPRVVAIAPAVIDLLNIFPSFDHHWRAYGEWSPAIKEYEREGIMDWQYSREYQRLLELVDPYSYRRRLDLPKFIVNAASDEFFLPDSWQFYWDSLPGEKYLRYVPNTGHSMRDTDAGLSLVAFFHHIVNGIPRPRFDWRVEADAIVVETDPAKPPQALALWRAVNPEGRDFRVYVIDKTWSSESITLNAEGRYRIPIGAPEKGFAAYFVEATFPAAQDAPLKLTSGVAVRPDVYPFSPYESAAPKGNIDAR